MTKQATRMRIAGLHPISLEFFSLPNESMMNSAAVASSCTPLIRLLFNRTCGEKLDLGPGMRARVITHDKGIWLQNIEGEEKDRIIYSVC